MSRMPISKILEKFYRQFNEQLKKLKADFSNDHLHQFRVAYKKLRAFTRLLSGDNKESALKLSKKVKSLYHIAGAARDMQLQYERIKKIWPAIKNEQQAYQQLLCKNIHYLKRKFKKYNSKKYLKENEKAIKKALPKMIYVSWFPAFINQQSNAVQSIVKQHSFNDEHLHDARKFLKDVFYNMDVYNENFSLKGLTILSKERQYQIKNLLDILGNHQDLRIAIGLLNMSGVKKLSSKCHIELSKVKLRLTAEKLELKQQAIKELENIFVESLGNVKYSSI